MIMKKKNNKKGGLAFWLGLAFAGVGTVLLLRNSGAKVGTASPETVLPTNHSTGSYTSSGTGTQTAETSTTTTRSGSSSAHR